MFEDIIISKYSDKVEEFLKILGKEEKEGVSCSKDGEIALQANCGGFDSHTLHTNLRRLLDKLDL